MKRMIDVVVASLMLIALWPVLVIVGLLVRVFMGRPIFFRQVRPGIGGAPFELLKFRTMRPQAATADPLPDTERLTPLGRALRASSLDELPQLFNVLRGDMSLVGPRPLLMQYLSRYSPRQARRHEVRPGITGWVQVNGRNSLSWEEKFEMDIWYVDHRSTYLDLKILCRSVFAVARREGINQRSGATMDEFHGHENYEGSDSDAQS